MRGWIAVAVVLAVAGGIAAPAFAQSPAPPTPGQPAQPGQAPAQPPGQGAEEAPREDITFPLMAIGGLLVLFAAVAFVIRTWPKPRAS